MGRVPASPAPSSTTPAWTPRYDASRATSGTRPLVNSPANLARQTGIGTLGTLLLTPSPKKRRPPRPQSRRCRIPYALVAALMAQIRRACTTLSTIAVQK